MNAALARPRSPEPRHPYHVGVAIGLGTGLYAVTLAAVTAMQVRHDEAVLVDRRPMQQAINLLSTTHDRMQLKMDAAWSSYEAATGGYNQAAARIAALQADLERLARTITGIEGTRFSVRGSAAAPGAPAKPGAPAAPGAPATNPVVVVAPPPAAAPPPTQATTGASGQP